MKLMVLGSAGMLGQEVVQVLQQMELPHVAMDIEDCDITVAGECLALMKDFLPSHVINCAAYTDVNKAEKEPELSFAINGQGAGNVARACESAKARCIQISTDYVFDGSFPDPYPVDATPNPLNTYGRGKLEGERQVAAALEDHAIIRTSWLYGLHGKNFVTTMLALSQLGKPLRIVSDQVGAPTYAADLAEAVVAIATCPARGCFHATNSGSCSWYEFASAIFELAEIDTSLLQPISASQYPTPAPRPANSRLSAARLKEIGVPPLPHWRDALERFMASLPQASR